jgi:hypothetical protein
MRTTIIRAGIVALAASSAVVAPATVLAVEAGAATTVPPVIVAHPDDVMVNTTTKLVGRGFATHVTLHVEECATTSWVVPADTCDATNAVTVTTNGKGKFTTQFTVQTCPTSATTGPGGLAFHCYIGVPSPTGIDTVSLRPYTGIVVTYP